MSSSSHEMPAVGTPFIILGADAVLAALPASPVQLAHACLALGFQLAAPATWGDELIAESCLEQLQGYEHPTAVMCSCPMVTERLTRASTTLEPFMLTFVSPPAATALYLRAAYEGQTLHITYAGACPGASDESIDARLRPVELLEAFAKSGIVVGDQPRSFDALVPLDRRRFFSLPGGAPARDHVQRLAHRALIELAGDDVVLDLTQQLFEQAPALVDLAVPLGCACAGAGEHALRGKPRAALLMLEPPRARQKVLDPSLRIDVAQPLAQAMTLCPESNVEDSAPLEVQLSADAPVPNDTPLSSDADAPSDVVATVERSVSYQTPIPAKSASRRPRRVVLRPSGAIPRYATESGELVPRASLAVVHRALSRIATRKAMRQPKLERTRRDIASKIHEGSSRTDARTAPPLAIAADLPRPVPPLPARYRPRAMLEL